MSDKQYMDCAKITHGPTDILGVGGKGNLPVGTDALTGTHAGEGTEYCDIAYFPYSMEKQHDIRLCMDAFDTAHRTGKSPSQLADELQELLEVAECVNMEDFGSMAELREVVARIQGGAK